MAEIIPFTNSHGGHPSARDPADGGSDSAVRLCIPFAPAVLVPLIAQADRVVFSPHERTTRLFERMRGGQHEGGCDICGAIDAECCVWMSCPEKERGRA